MGSLLTGRFGRCTGLVCFHVGPKTVLVCNVANLPEHAVLVLVTIGALDLVRAMAFLLFPLLVSLMVNDFVTVFVRMELVVFLMVLLRMKWSIKVIMY